MISFFGSMNIVRQTLCDKHTILLHNQTEYASTINSRRWQQYGDFMHSR